MIPAYNPPSRLPAETPPLVSELLSLLEIAEREPLPERPPGTIVSKIVRGQRYWYLQYAALGERRQLYLGPDDTPTRAQIERLKGQWETIREDDPSRERLVAMILAGGVPAPEGRSAKLISTLSRFGAFRAGAVLVGSHAFAAYGPLLGYRWQRGFRTDDVDLGIDPRVAVAVGEQPGIPAALDASQQGFLPVPGLDPRSPSTSFKVRGQTLRLDLLTPLHGPPSSQPVEIPALGISALPLRYLDYLIQDPVPGAILWRSAAPVRLPRPGRFALHKLILSSRRPPHEASRARKDLDQAEQLLAVLLDDRPGDLQTAWEPLRTRPAAWRTALRQGLSRLHPEVRGGVEERLR